MENMSINEKKIRKTLEGKANIQGFSKKIRKRIVDGREVEEEVIKVYVTKKVDPKTLAMVDLIPKEIDGIPTDVVEIGKVEALGLKDKVRPLVAGYSIGNLDISAGTLGWYFEKGGKTYVGSNTHILSDNIGPLCIEKRIVQPGKQDDGEVPDDKVGTHVWHKPLKRALNPFNALWMVLVNLIYQILGQDPPNDLTDSTPRQLDFGVMEATVPYEKKIEGLQEWSDFVGLAFAGSDTFSFICKAKYILQEGYTPVDVDVVEVGVDEVVHKVGRTTGYTTGRVVDDSAFVWVSYGGFGNDRPFDDVIMTEKMLEGGDSGSSVWRHATPS
jgi:hypothetical protein